MKNLETLLNAWKTLGGLLLLLMYSVVAVAQTKSADAFYAQFGDKANMKCGFLEVPEDHNDTTGCTIRIAYVVLKAKNLQAASYPIIYFMGGPGGEVLSTEFVNMWLESPFLERGDVILFDQRGTNYSAELPNMANALFNIMATNSNVPNETQLFSDTLKKYQAICAEQKINVGFYNSEQNAKDVGKLMQHLGYAKYNLYGVSYGGRLARWVQEYFPNRLNTVILDSPSPLNSDFLLSRLQGFQITLARVFAFCEADSLCQSLCPNLNDALVHAVKDLSCNPLFITLSDSTRFVLNPQDAMYLIRRAMYKGDALEFVPALIQELELRKTARIKNMLEREKSLYFGMVNHTMFLSVESHSQFNQSNTKETICAIYEDTLSFPARLGYFEAMYAAGENWPTSKMPKTSRSFKVSTIPTLILGNQYDVATPPEVGPIFKEKLPNAHLLILNHAGHGAFDGSASMWKLLLDFIEEPNSVVDNMKSMDLYHSSE